MATYSPQAYTTLVLQNGDDLLLQNGDLLYVTSESGISPVAVAASVPAVNAGYHQVEQASVAPIQVNCTTPAPSPNAITSVLPTVAYVSASIPSVLPTYLSEISAQPVVATVRIAIIPVSLSGIWYGGGKDTSLWESSNKGSQSWTPIDKHDSSTFTEEEKALISNYLMLQNGDFLCFQNNDLVLTHLTVPEWDESSKQSNSWSSEDKEFGNVRFA